MQKIVGLLLLIAQPVILFSQRTEIGVFIGGTNYFGDLADAIYVTKETNFSMGGLVRFNVHPRHSIKLNAYFGRITAHDSNSSDEGLLNRDFSFSSPITEFAGNYEWNILGRSLYNNIGEFVALFTPFVGAGIAYTLAPGKPVAPPGAPAGLLPENGDVDVFICVPLTGGVKYYPHPNISLALELGFRPAFNDYLDGVSQTANPDANDWYIKGGFTIAYLFNKGPDFMNRDKNF